MARRLVSTAFAAALPMVLVVPSAFASPLYVVHVSRPAVNFMFNPTGVVVGTATAGGFHLFFGIGFGYLQTVTYRSDPASPAAGRWVYEYQINLELVNDDVGPACVESLEVPFGPVGALDYNHDTARDHVFVVTSGGLGTVGLSSASWSNGVVTFNFNFPLCGGLGSEGINRTYSFGLTSWMPPKAVTATVNQIYGFHDPVAARAPGLLPLPFTSGTSWVGLLTSAAGHPLFAGLHIVDQRAARFVGTLSIGDMLFALEGTVSASGEFHAIGRGGDGDILLQGRYGIQDGTSNTIVGKYRLLRAPPAGAAIGEFRFVELDLTGR